MAKARIKSTVKGINSVNKNAVLFHDIPPYASSLSYIYRTKIAQ